MWTILSVTDSYLLFILYREQHKVSTRLRKRVIDQQQQQPVEATQRHSGEFDKQKMLVY